MQAPTLTSSSVFAAQTSTMSISQESAPVPLPAAKTSGSSTPSTSTVVPAAEPNIKRQPRPRPRQKGTTVGRSCAVVTVEAHNSTITTPARASSLPEGGTQEAVSRLPQPNHTTVGVDLEQNPPGPSADSQSESTTDALTR
jgi:hypothetical protein